MTPKTKSLPQWNLTQLYSSEKAFEKDVAALKARVQSFGRFRKKLSSPSRTLLEEIMNEMEETSRMTRRISAYAQLSHDLNTSEEKGNARMASISQMGAELSNQELFFGMWWKELDEKKVKALLPRNRDHAFFLLEARKMRKYVLKENEEAIINLKNANGAHAMERIYNQLKGEMRFDWNGKKVNEERVRKYTQSHRSDERTAAYHSLWNEYARVNNVYGEIYRTIVQDYWNEEIELRKFASPISVRNISNDLPDDLIETFLGVCEENTQPFHRYFEWKAKELGTTNSRYHAYAPLPISKTKWEFQPAYEKVIQTFESFSPRFATEAKRVLASNRLDMGIHPGKKGGAYAFEMPPGEPAYVMHNWAGTPDDVSTLAHELGHAVHFHLASKHSIFVSATPIPIAETASVFAEMVLTEQLMEESTDEKLVRYLLSNQIQDAFGSITRQVSFTRFEQESFNLIRAGKTVSEINQLYYRMLPQSFGKKMSIPSDAQYEWAGIDHFFDHPFYVYSYAFGQLLVLAFFERYQKEGKEFVREYERFLEYGGSEHPVTMLNQMGFNPYKRKSWENGFHVIEKKRKALQKL